MKKVMTFLGSTLALLLVVTIYFQKTGMGFCDKNFFRCETYIDFLMIFFPIAIFSLLTYFSSKTFPLWEKFTVGFLVLHIGLLSIFPQQAHFLQPSRGDVALLLVVIYIAVSLILIAARFLKSKV